MLKRLLLLFVLFLLVVLVVVDRVGAIVAAQVLASKVKTDEHLADRPDVTIGGFPFLTQAIEGKYSDVKVTVHDLSLNRLDVSTFAVQLHGAHIPLRRRCTGRPPGAGRPGRRSGDGHLRRDGRLSEVETSQVSPAAGGQLKVTGSLTIAGHRLTASGTGYRDGRAQCHRRTRPSGLRRDRLARRAPVAGAADQLLAAADRAALPDRAGVGEGHAGRHRGDRHRDEPGPRQHLTPHAWPIGGAIAPRMAHRVVPIAPRNGPCVVP